MYYHENLIFEAFIKIRMMSIQLYNILAALELKSRDRNISMATLKIFSTNQVGGSEKSATRPRSDGAREGGRGMNGGERRGSPLGSFRTLGLLP